LHGKKIKGIAYVDDNSPIETSKEDMEHVLNKMNRAVVDLGMKNNVNKLEVYSINAGKNETIIIDGFPLKIKSGVEFRTLGMFGSRW
jgi:hypothetical protein